MSKKDNYETWYRLFESENNINLKGQKKQAQKDENIGVFITTLFFSLTGLALLILLIVFAIIGDSLRNLILLGVLSVICISIFVICLFILLGEKTKKNSESHNETSPKEEPPV